MEALIVANSNFDKNRICTLLKKLEFCPFENRDESLITKFARIRPGTLVRNRKKSALKLLKKVTHTLVP